MKIDDFDKTKNSELELTEEQKKYQHDFLISGFINKNKYIFSVLKNKMKNTEKTLQDLHDEVINKKSNLTRSQRDFLLIWKLDFLQECLDVINKKSKKL